MHGPQSLRPFRVPAGVILSPRVTPKSREVKSLAAGEGCGSLPVGSVCSSRVLTCVWGQCNCMARLIGASLAWMLTTVAVALPNASARPRVDYKQMFTTQVAGRSTGTDVRLLYKNPNDPKGKPIRVRREEFTLPAGTTYDQTVVPDCTASDAEILLFGTSACPAASHIGSSQGATSMSGFGTGEDPIDLDFWDDGGVLVLWGRSHQFPAIGAVARGHQKGQTMTVDVPRSPGGPPDGESAVRRVHNVFPARS